MATSFDLPIEGFLRRVEADRDFFQYYRLSQEEANALALNRAKYYLQEAVAIITLACNPAIDFNDKDDAEGVFNVDLTAQEVYLLAALMYEAYLGRDVAKLKTMSVNYAYKELKTYDPSNARTSFLALYENVQRENANLLDIYKNTDRLTGKFKDINFSSYDE